MFALSFSYKTSGAEDRQCFSFDSETTEELLTSLALSSVPQAVYLFTCNRVELYATGDACRALDVLCGFA